MWLGEGGRPSAAAAMVVDEFELCSSIVPPHLFPDHMVSSQSCLTRSSQSCFEESLSLVYLTDSHLTETISTL